MRASCWQAPFFCGERVVAFLLPGCSQGFHYSNMSVRDQEYMRLALEEGSKGLGLTAPNPSVGALIVKDGVVIGKGYHKKAGLPHAEREALADCKRLGHDPRGSEIFITLEPCSTTGRTPPCTTAILEAGIRRVVWAADDPNPAHCGAAALMLREAGLKVCSGVLAGEAEFLHRAFFKVQRVGLPWVIVKTAMSLDGRITRPPEEGQWLTGKEARADVQELRGEADVMLTSGATARMDNPRLNYRGNRVEKKQPLRMVVTRQEKAGLTSGAHLLTPNEGGSTRFLSGDLSKHFFELAQEGFHTVMVEAGGALVGQLLELGLVDEWIGYLAPLVCGGDVPATAGTGILSLEQRPRLEKVSYQQLGADIRVRGLLRKETNNK